jgi:hypothetical protein
LWELTEKVGAQGDIALLKTYGLGPYSTAIKRVEEDIKKLQASQPSPPHMAVIYSPASWGMGRIR